MSNRSQPPQPLAERPVDRIPSAATFAIARFKQDPSDAVSEVLAAVLRDRPIGDAVFLKPNFTYSRFKEGVTTTREVIVATVKALKDLGAKRICIGEGDGGYNTFSMDETMRAYRLDELSTQFGVEVANVSRWPSLRLEVSSRHGRRTVDVPRPIFEEFDRFVTLPVPKVHAMTTISGALKNQWGIVQDPMRIKLHCAFDEIIAEITRRLPNPIAMIDGTHGLTKNGPMVDGIAIPLGWVACSDSLGAADRALCRIMQMPVTGVSHLQYASRVGLVPPADAVTMVGDLDGYVDRRFYLQRNIWNYAAMSTWHSPRLAHFVYFSHLSSVLHRVMYTFRGREKDLKFKGMDWS